MAGKLNGGYLFDEQWEANTAAAARQDHHGEERSQEGAR